MNRNRTIWKVVAGMGLLALTAVAAAAVHGGRAATDNTAQDTATAMPGMTMSGSNASARAMAVDSSMRLTPGEVKAFGVTFGMVEERPLTREIRAVGTVGFDETRMTWVAPKFGGWAERLHVDFTGQRVRKGQPLLDVYSPELVTAQQELLLAAHMADSVGHSPVAGVAGGAMDLLDAARRRLSWWDVPEEEISRVLETGEVEKVLTLDAPSTGVVMEKHILQGQAFQPGDNLYMIADLSEVWIDAQVFESDVSLVRAGMPARIAVAGLPGREFRGEVTYVYPTLQDRTRSMRARVQIPNPDGALKPGMYATVSLSARLGEALTVPTSAVLHTGRSTVAFVDLGGGHIVPRELRLGLEGDDRAQVLDGLAGGERVVTSAQFLLDSESNLAEVMKAMMAQMSTSDMGGKDMKGMGGMQGMDMGGGDSAMAMPAGMDMKPGGGASGEGRTKDTMRARGRGGR